MYLIYYLFGEGADLNVLQMSVRALLFYTVATLLVRIAGMRAFGKKSAFDTIIVIMLGAVLSRAVVGASPIFPTIAAGLVFAIAHRFLAILSIRVKGLGKIIKGTERVLYKDGIIYHDNMRKSLITDGDLMEGVRLNTGLNSLAEVKEVYMERSGQISVIKKDNSSADRRLED